MDWLSLIYSSFGTEQAQWLSYSCVGLFVAVVILFIFVVFVGGPKPRVRAMIYAGLGSCALLGLISAYLYVWHHYVRA